MITKLYDPLVRDITYIMHQEIHSTSTRKTYKDSIHTLLFVIDVARRRHTLFIFA